MTARRSGLLAGLIVGVIAVFGLTIWLSGASLSVVVSTLYTGSLGTPGHLTETLARTTPLLLAGLAVFFALKAGLFNIGVEGQLIIGALVCGVCVARVPGPLGLAVGAFLGCGAGALWAWPAGWIKAYRGGHEVITTIMLNNVAGFMAVYLAAGPFKARGQQSPTTQAIDFRLPEVSVRGVHFNLALFGGIALALLLKYWLDRAVKGYNLRLVGANREAARFAGVNVAQTTSRAMVISGAIAGLAGVVQVLAFEGRFYPEISSGIGFDALGVALLAGGSPMGLIPSAFGFGALASGSTQLAINGVPRGITGIILGLVIIAAAGFRFQAKRVDG